jgi:hypothetical protein
MESGLGVIGQINVLANHRTRHFQFGWIGDLAGDSTKDPPLMRSRTRGLALMFKTQPLTARGRVPRYAAVPAERD